MINEDRMGSEHNMAGRLPAPPAPSPETREAAIARALQQFDRAQAEPALDRAHRESAPGPHLLQPASAAPVSAPRGRMTLGRPSVRYLVAASVAAFIAVPVGWIYLQDSQQLESGRNATKVQPEKTTPVPPLAESRSVGDRSAAVVPPATEPPAPAPRATPRSEQPPAQDAAPERRARKAAPGAVATREGALGACSAGDPEARISGCTRIIEDRARGTADRRQAFLERGMAYARRGEFDRAIGDFTEAIRLDPGNAAAFYNRSLAYRAKGEHDRARADCSAASGLSSEYRARC